MQITFKFILQELLSISGGTMLGTYIGMWSFFRQSEDDDDAEFLKRLRVLMLPAGTILTVAGLIVSLI